MTQEERDDIFYQMEKNIIENRKHMEKKMNENRELMEKKMNENREKRWMKYKNP
jgi:hypothetical protein